MWLSSKYVKYYHESQNGIDAIRDGRTDGRTDRPTDLVLFSHFVSKTEIVKFPGTSSNQPIPTPQMHRFQDEGMEFQFMYATGAMAEPPTVANCN